MYRPIKKTNTGINISDCFKREIGVLKICSAVKIHSSEKQNVQSRLMIISKKTMIAVEIIEKKQTVISEIIMYDIMLVSDALIFIFNWTY